MEETNIVLKLDTGGGQGELTGEGRRQQTGGIKQHADSLSISNTNDGAMSRLLPSLFNRNFSAKLSRCTRRQQQHGLNNNVYER